ncbi:MAG: hypothetical protein ABIF85_07910 [Nanoarchaeota archaeon]|nr:hypothetical protein [Nanoarchaeota archaeon]MBU4300840.1 hypothetical protein [Nanoarchaeota archaeon]MBU4452015.1 hypothetical protein [Nanoarchaeota archaeon]MCG2724472.1 hypothetical protein [archaeon]
MKKTTVLFLAFLVLVVAISGCFGNKETNTPTTSGSQQTVPSGISTSESIPSADDGAGLTIETPQASADENVDLGSLI